MIPVQDLVPAKSLVDQVYREIRNRILENIWTPGYQALEQEIAQMLGVSRTPVREALIRLEKESFVKVVPRHGMRVLPVSPEDMKEIYEVLTALECCAAERLASRRPSANELQPLIDATQRMSEALERDDLDAWAKADETFHWALVSMSGNKLLLQTVMGYWDRAHRARLFTLRLRPKPVNSTKEHMQLVERLAAGDAAGAVNVNREHRERASRELVVIFERYRLQQL
jgi:DNA-binding GntR family transcriptional regulator